MVRTLCGRAGGRATATAAAAAATAMADKLSQPFQAASPRHAGINYPVRETPHSGNDKILDEMDLEWTFPYLEDTFQG